MLIGDIYHLIGGGDRDGWCAAGGCVCEDGAGARSPPDQGTGFAEKRPKIVATGWCSRGAGGRTRARSSAGRGRARG